MKVAFFGLEKWKQDYIKENLKGHKLIFFEKPLTDKNISKIKDVEGVGIFLHSLIDVKKLDKLPKLKNVYTMSTGFDHIDLDECKKRRIKVYNVPNYGENTVAEHAFGLLLDLSKNIHEGVEKTRKDIFSFKGLLGFDLKGKTFGVIGAGSIGQHSIKIAKGFEMDVIAFNRSRDGKLAKKLGFTYKSLDYLFKHSDIITLHLPLTPKTKHLVNMKNIKKMKKGVYIINTARGGLIETRALIYGLQKGIIAGAGLDVLEEEEDLKEHHSHNTKKFSKEEKLIFKQNHKLLKKLNVNITPHSAFFTIEALKRILNTTIQNIKSPKKENRVA